MASSNLSMMAEKQSEDDEEDDEGFGDFKFAPYPIHASPSDRIFGRVDGDEDEWGDFINHHPSPNQTSNGDPARFGSSSGQSRTPDNFHPLVSFSGQRSESENGSWVKPRGALPLSIFGDEDEEGKDGGSEDANSIVGDAANLFHNDVDLSKRASKINMGIKIDEVIADLYNQKEELKSPNGPHSSSNHAPSPSNLNGAHSSSGIQNLIDNGSEPIEANPNVNGFVSGLNDLNSEFVDVNDYFEYQNEWEFKGAEVETDGGILDFEGQGVPQFSAWKVESLAFNQENGAANIGQSGKGAHVSGVSHSMTNGLIGEHEKLDVASDLKPMIAQHDKTTHNAVEDGSESHALDENANVDDDVWEFKDASSKTLEIHEEEAAYVSHNGVEEFTSDIKIQYACPQNLVRHEDAWDVKDGLLSYADELEGEQKDADHCHTRIESFTSPSESLANEMKLENHEGVLSNFYGGGIMPNADESIDLHDIFINKTTSPQSNNIYSQGSSMPVNDLILNLYNETPRNHTVDSSQCPSENGLGSSQKALDTETVNGDDDFDDGSWEFKDASSESRLENMNPVNLWDIDKKSPNTSVVDEFVDFYGQLKKKSGIVLLCHLDALKNAGSVATLSNEGGGAVVFHEEYQEDYKELQQCFILDEDSFGSCPQRHVDLDEFVEVLHQPKYHSLNSEFHLSGKLLLAEKELKSAIELWKHAVAMLKILEPGSEKVCTYISIWLNIISSCARELQHGALLWKQVLQKSVQSEILSEPRGQKFIVALGEIYRVVEVIGASVRLYKPWMLIGVADLVGIFAHIEECCALWSCSGLEKALWGLCDPVGFEYDGTTKALLESIQYIHDIGPTSLQSHFVFQRDQPACKLSLLTAGALPGMELVTWSEECYFVKVANAWANLVSRDPPDFLPRSIGS